MHARRSSIVHEFVNYDGVIDDQDVYSCKGEGCCKTTKARVGASFPASGWADHIVTRCSGISQKQKERVAIACKTKKLSNGLKASTKAVETQNPSHPTSLLHNLQLFSLHLLQIYVLTILRLIATILPRNASVKLHCKHTGNSIGVMMLELIKLPSSLQNSLFLPLLPSQLLSLPSS